MAAAIHQPWQVVLLLALGQAMVLVVACRTDVLLQTIAPCPSWSGRIGEPSQHGCLGRINEECHVRGLEAKAQGWLFAVGHAVV